MFNILNKENNDNFFNKLVKGLNKTRNSIVGGIDDVFNSFKKIDEELFEELEEALIMADIGVKTSLKLIEELKEIAKNKNIKEVDELKELLIDKIKVILTANNKSNMDFNEKTVLLVIGVNGVGKTTTIAKIANNYKKENKSLLLAAADTFRAAAIDQLKVWAERINVNVISQGEKADPAAVVYDAVQSAKSKDVDLLICDTAGRLHNKKNLMKELEKINKVIKKEYTEAKLEVLLVLDATTGQNALQQAKQFNEVTNITGIALTKLDGTAKGGIVVAIKDELDIPIEFIGVGEGIDDLQKFDPNEFAEALFR